MTRLKTETGAAVEAAEGELVAVMACSCCRRLMNVCNKRDLTRPVEDGLKLGYISLQLSVILLGHHGGCS